MKTYLEGPAALIKKLTKSLNEIYPNGMPRRENALRVAKTLSHLKVSKAGRVTVKK